MPEEVADHLRSGDLWAVRVARLWNTIDRLQAARQRQDRLPATRLAACLADDLRSLHDHGDLGAASVWCEEAVAALAAAASDPLSDDLTRCIDRLAEQVTRLTGRRADSGNEVGKPGRGVV
jgi:hypothetical protein